MIQIAHGHYGAIKASQDDHGAVHRGVAVAAHFAQMLKVSEHIACGELVRGAILQRRAHPFAELLQGVLISGDGERAQPSRDAVGANIELDPERPFHEQPPIPCFSIKISH